MQENATFEADHYLSVAEQYFAQGQYDRALAVCQQSVQIHKRDPRLWDRLIISAWVLDHWTVVIRGVRRASRLCPQRPLVRLALADAYLALGRKPKGLQVLISLTRLRMCGWDLLPTVADRLFRSGEYRRSLRIWRRLARHRSDNPEFHYQIAVCMWALDATPEELFLPLHEAVLLAPGHPKYAMALAKVWLDAGSPCDAAEVMAQVDPTHVTCNNCKWRTASLFRDLGEPAIAAKWDETV